jgi:type IV pilus assembly protein PilB
MWKTMTDLPQDVVPLFRAAPPRRMLGERLVERGLISERQLEMAIREQKRTGAMVGEILTQLGFVTPQMLSAALAEQGGVQHVDLSELDIPVEVVDLIPEAVARRLVALAVERTGNEVTVVLGNIYDVAALEELESLTSLRVRVAAAAEDDILARINEAYGEQTSLEDLIEEAIRSAVLDRGGAEGELLPVVKVVDQLLFKAVKDRATDIHVQPSERTVITRFRVDGTLHQGPTLPKTLQSAVLTRLKIMSEVNIAESRMPQDGKFQFALGSRRFDIRSSFLPSTYGEKVVLRILDKSKLIMGLDQLNMPPNVNGSFRAMLDRPHGVILVTGPTGSGKTTTLYSALNDLNSSDRCIVTVEDPVEYELPLITQVQVNLKAGLTFATGLRSILRQDPDIILIGEIRDGETAGIAMRAAMTGHLVLSTLHTNDPVSAIPRLRDMGVSRLELAAAVLGIHAQRLVRSNCPVCTQPYEPEEATLALLRPEQRKGPWRRGTGCEVCDQKGILGRRPVHDLLYITPAIRQLIADDAPLAEIEVQARREGKTSLFDHALSLARKGLIPLEEAVRVTMVED